VACLALVALLSADWIAAIHGDDDPVCDPLGSLAPGNPTAAVVGPGTGAGSAQHCPICHWLRSLRSVAAHASLVSIAIVPTGPLGPDLRPPEIHVAALRIPARSPPA